ncbi:MAG: hypothetical protein EB056_02695 [Verrucomicrobia bacterium]|nr:hypothetical protein [Verrucomicrobiota bacterium]
MIPLKILFLEFFTEKRCNLRIRMTIKRGGKGDWQVEAKDGGVYLPQVDFWMDPKKPQERALVTHAHYDHLAAHGEILASPGTAELLKVRVPKGTRIRKLEFGKPLSLGGGARLTLQPAGHILGSSMALVERNVGGARKKSRLLYTGDFKLRSGLSAERCQPVRADVLVMETTFGLPKYRLPSAEKVIGEILEFCRENLAQRRVPVLLGYALGKSQEIMSILAREKWPLLLHPSIQTMAGIYRKMGVALPEGQTLNATTGKRAEGHVVLCPPQVIRAKGLQKLGDKKTAMLSGWALEVSAFGSCRLRRAVGDGETGSAQTGEDVAWFCPGVRHGFAGERDRGVGADGRHADGIANLRMKMKFHFTMKIANR